MLALEETITMVSGGVDDVGDGDDGDGPRASACLEVLTDACPNPREHVSEATWRTLQISGVSSLLECA